MDETVLPNNEHRPIIKMGNTIHRPTHWWTSSVHHLLNYLESVQFPYSPRVLGFDDQGREILTYMPGESGKAGWYKIQTDEGLQNLARLLKEYHQAIAGYQPLENAQWAYSRNGLKAGEIMCHGDFGPWNITWDGNRPTGIIDWDFVLPARPEYDVCYALQYAVPFRNDDTTRSWHHFEKVPDRKHRVKLFLETYGIEIHDVSNSVADVQMQDIKHIRHLAGRGLRP